MVPSLISLLHKFFALSVELFVLLLICVILSLDAIMSILTPLSFIILRIKLYIPLSNYFEYPFNFLNLAIVGGFSYDADSWSLHL